MTTQELLKQAYEMIHDLKKKANEHHSNEEIAVVGMALRLPGGCNNPKEYWDFLKSGKPAAIEVPADRWNIDEYYSPEHQAPGKMYIRKANFLQRDVSEFDARFFKISPAEASAMDPQQRYLLEVSYEALENAGQNPAELVGSSTGVFIGINSTCEYNLLPRDTESFNQYLGTGTTSSIASGRISYTFGFNGPTISVDTACSSSLVSTLLAVDALQNNQCDMALAGGVNMLLSPTAMTALCMMNALSESGMSAPFDAKADGYGRGEGVGILVLKRLSDAVRDNDRIYATICGGAINNDGASSGLTVPNGDAQRMVIQKALKNCNLKPGQISYLETHGTGTALGDPIEVRALTEVFGKSKREKPLILGAVKGNIGHTESAAGVSGLIKVILSLYNKEIVPVCNFNTQNPRVDFSKIPAVLPLEAMKWEMPENTERIAGISSFGFSGTNAHVILKEAPGPKEREATDSEEKENALCISAKETAALRQLLERYEALLKDEKSPALKDICYTANTGRASYNYRYAFYGKDKDEIVKGIEQRKALMDENKNEPALITTNPKYAFLFDEDIPEYEPLDNPEFKKPYDELMGKAKELLGDKKDDAVDRFIYEYALITFLSKLDICPEIVSGIGTGVYAAAVAAGMLSGEDALKLLSKDRKLISDFKEPKMLHPICRYLSCKNHSTNVDMSADYVCQDASYKEASPDEISKFFYNEGYRYIVSFGKAKEKFKEIKKDVIYVDFLAGNDKNPENEITKALAVCFENGTSVRFKYFYNKERYNKVVLPNYPFAKNKYWIQGPNENNSKENAIFGGRGLDGRILNLPGRTKQIEYGFTLENFKELKDNTGVVHLGYFIEMLYGNLKNLYPDEDFTIKTMEFSSPVMVMEMDRKQVLLSIEDDKDGDLSFAFYSKGADEKNWAKNVSGLLSPEKEEEGIGSAIPADFDHEDRTGDEFYSVLEDRGLSFGEAVRWVDHVNADSDEAVAEFRPSTEEDNSLYAIGYHPGIVDSCAQVCNYLVMKDDENSKKYMISALSDVTIRKASGIGKTKAFVKLKSIEDDKDTINCKLCLETEGGQMLLNIDNALLKRFDDELIMKLSKMNESIGKGGVDRAFLTRYTEVDDNEKQRILAEYVRDILAEVLGMDKEELKTDDPIADLGLDSMSGLIFHQRTTISLGVELPIVDLMDGETCNGTAKLLMDLLPGGKSYGKQDAFTRTAYDLDLSLEHWIYDYKENPKAKMRLFCFPYGFGSASMYKDWQEYFGEEVDVCAFKIPGLDSERMKELPPDDIDKLMETIDKVIGDKLMDLPCATFGNSWGSLFSYRLAKRLSRDERADIKVCIISGYTSPSLPNTSLMQILGELEKIGYDHIPTDEEIGSTNSLEEMSRAFISAWGQSVQSEDKAVSGTKLTLNYIASA
jgi:acyl transferase domain-containing protein/acyl carrier protein